MEGWWWGKKDIWRKIVNGLMAEASTDGKSRERVKEQSLGYM